MHNVVVSFLGYTPETVFEIETTARPAVVNVALNEAAIADAAGSGRRVTATVEEAPWSVRSIGTNEIKRNPGEDETSVGRCGRCRGGCDPEVRNDIVIRGGAQRKPILPRRH